MQRCRKSRRSGAAALEAAVVLPTFFILVFGMFDLSIIILRQVQLSEAARTGARIVSIHGKRAGLYGGTEWGDSTIYIYASSTSYPIATELSPLLVGFNKSTTTIRVEWIGGGNDVQAKDTVRVTLTASIKPMITALFGSANLTLSAASRMPIAF